MSENTARSVFHRNFFQDGKVNDTGVQSESREKFYCFIRLNKVMESLKGRKVKILNKFLIVRRKNVSGLTVGVIQYKEQDH